MSFCPKGPNGARNEFRKKSKKNGGSSPLLSEDCEDYGKCCPLKYYSRDVKEPTPPLYQVGQSVEVTCPASSIEDKTTIPGIIIPIQNALNIMEAPLDGSAALEASLKETGMNHESSKIKRLREKFEATDSGISGPDLEVAAQESHKIAVRLRDAGKVNLAEEAEKLAAKLRAAVNKLVYDNECGRYIDGKIFTIDDCECCIDRPKSGSVWFLADMERKYFVEYENGYIDLVFESYLSKKE